MPLGDLERVVGDLEGVVCNSFDALLEKQNGVVIVDGGSESVIGIEFGVDAGFQLSNRCRRFRTPGHGPAQGMRTFLGHQDEGRIEQFYLANTWSRSWRANLETHERQIKVSKTSKMDAWTEGQGGMSSV